jgi:hypothetical protein
MHGVFIGDAKAFTITTGESLRGILVVPVNRTNSVDDVLCGEPSARRDNGSAGWKMTDLGDDSPAFHQNRRPSGTMDRAIDTAATQQRRIRRVHNGVGSLFGYVGRTVKFYHLFRGGFRVQEKTQSEVPH